ncbi:MAG: hypothetical protein K8H99_03300, partial [Nitrospirae bacterium]|nr:hypothetical protein [Fimbriimonadaceae bacterium]
IDRLTKYKEIDAMSAMDWGQWSINRKVPVDRVVKIFWINLAEDGIEGLVAPRVASTCRGEQLGGHCGLQAKSSCFGQADGNGGDFHC